MNKKTLALISAVAILSACEPPAQKTEQAQTDTTIKDTTVNIPVKTSPPKAAVLAKKIKGEWVSTEDETGNVTFVIDDNTFMYPDHDMDTQYKYKWKGDSINIDYNDEVLTFKVSFKGDTLVLADQSATTYYTRMKQ
ncbi:hypothetical protein IM792_11670 [Mucilaginibacter sp. JRF]|uniref:hypothetical protein n=1 Tax=Mucilaginibacter sp. JRF TaxID=2780088 RepID=UPI001880D9A7|nr:hypothetical protein [Mucilaginibacter sp. JRF]MBE9585109.1 hypothetical protein [Mucilaginibacter sp. JRF]